MLYLSKPNGTHAVFIGEHSQGAYDIVKLNPGGDYRHRSYFREDFVGERDFFKDACEWADTCDEATAKRTAINA